MKNSRLRLNPPGRPALPPDTWRSELRLPGRVARELKRRAKAERRSLNSQIVILIEKGLMA